MISQLVGDSVPATSHRNTKSQEMKRVTINHTLEGARLIPMKCNKYEEAGSGGGCLHPAAAAAAVAAEFESPLDD